MSKEVYYTVKNSQKENENNKKNNKNVILKSTSIFKLFKVAFTTITISVANTIKNHKKSKTTDFLRQEDIEKE